MKLINLLMAATSLASFPGRDFGRGARADLYGFHGTSTHYTGRRTPGGQVAHRRWKRLRASGRR